MFVITLGSRQPLAPTRYDAVIFVLVGQYLILLTAQLAAHPPQVALYKSWILPASGAQTIENGWSLSSQVEQSFETIFGDGVSCEMGMFVASNRSLRIISIVTDYMLSISNRRRG
jgi:hypothetical protein